MNRLRRCGRDVANIVANKRSFKFTYRDGPPHFVDAATKVECVCNHLLRYCCGGVLIEGAVLDDQCAEVDSSASEEMRQEGIRKTHHP